MLCCAALAVRRVVCCAGLHVPGRLCLQFLSLPGHAASPRRGGCQSRGKARAHVTLDSRSSDRASRIHPLPLRAGCRVLAAFYREAVKRLNLEERLDSLQRAAAQPTPTRPAR